MKRPLLKDPKIIQFYIYCKAQKQRTMKRIMVAVAAVLISGAVIASPLGDSKKDKASVAKDVTIGADYYKIVVDDDIDLALVESGKKDMRIFAKGNTHDDVNWKIKDGVLYLSSNGSSLKDKVKITLTVNKLRQDRKSHV